jgi:hypothetical protein
MEVKYLTRVWGGQHKRMQPHIDHIREQKVARAPPPQHLPHKERQLVNPIEPGQEPTQKDRCDGDLDSAPDTAKGRGAFSQGY